MAAGYWLKTAVGSTWTKVTNFYVKTSTSGWSQVQDAWVKISTTTWSKFYAALMAPSQDVEIAGTYGGYNSEILQLRGKNYVWSPTPQSLKYYFREVNEDGTYYIGSGGSNGATATNTVSFYPSSSTFVTISPDGSNYKVGGLTKYFFEVRGTGASGTVYSSLSADTGTAIAPTIESPLAPTLTEKSKTGTSITITITAAADTTGTWGFSSGGATYRYIVYTYDTTSGTVYTGGGRGGIPWSSSAQDVTLTGLVAGRQYFIYVLPVTGSLGSRPFPYNASTQTNGYSGYPGAEASIVVTTETPYKFAFGDQLSVSTNGFIGLKSLPDNTTDSFPSVGEFLGIFQRDLQQAASNSIWYWSDSTDYIIRWEGYDYNTALSKIYQVTFYKDVSFVDVYAIQADGSAGSTTAYIKNGNIRSTYLSSLATGSMRRVYFDGTATATITGLTVKAKSAMKQVTGYTAGSADRGYTTLTTATNENNFTAGTIKVSGGSTETSNGLVSNGATLTVSTADWPTGTTFTYQWKKTRDIGGLVPTNAGTATTQSVSTVGEQFFCVVSYSETTSGASGTVTSFSYTVVPAKPTYTLTNNTDGTFTISSVASTGGGFYYGTWKLGSGSNNTISRTALATNSQINSTAGSVSVTLFGSANVTYSGNVTPTSIDGWESTTNSVTVTTVVEDMVVTAATYSAPTTAAVNYTTFASGSVDDGFFQLTLPYAITVNGKSYSTIYVGTNSYVTFEAGSTAYSSLGAAIPSNPKIMIDALDRGSAGIYYASSAAGWTIRYEGSSSTSGSPIAIIWQLSGVSTNKKRMRLDIKQVAGGGITGAYDKNGNLKNALGGGSTSYFIDSSGATTGATAIGYVAPTTNAVNLTTYTSGSVDDGFFSIGLPFTTYFNGTAYNTIHIGSNSYATFGAGSTQYSGLSASNPPNDKIMIDALDRGSAGIYTTATASSWTIRYQGSSGTSGSPVSIIWELFCQSATPRTIRLSIQSVAGGGITGMYSSSSLINALGGSGTSWNITSA
jgi:hypothetical protein